jgi:hypothetical protein
MAASSQATNTNVNKRPLERQTEERYINTGRKPVMTDIRKARKEKALSHLATHGKSITLLANRDFPFKFLT